MNKYHSFKILNRYNISEAKVNTKAVMVIDCPPVNLEVSIKVDIPIKTKSNVPKIPPVKVSARGINSWTNVKLLGISNIAIIGRTSSKKLLS